MRDHGRRGHWPNGEVFPLIGGTADSGRRVAYGLPMRAAVPPLLTVLVAALVVCTAASSASRTAVVLQFRTPTGNIGCAFSSGLEGDETPTIRCDIRSRLQPPPKPPKGCQLDSGDSIQITRFGRAILVCHGDTAIDPHSRVLAYGHMFRRDGVGCVSRAVGITCTNARGHGFFMSRQSWRIF